MKRHVLIYGVIGGILITVTAATFAVLGIWLGLRLTSKQNKIEVKKVLVPANGPF